MILLIIRYAAGMIFLNAAYIVNKKTKVDNYE